ncbi:MAG: hypothetical protein M1835_007012 [Candelina submexicana]|nr:MAG: hypothetical protein M1835_007012 [Candelina submexicana]
MGELLEPYDTLEEWEKEIDHRPSFHDWYNTIWPPEIYGKFFDRLNGLTRAESKEMWDERDRFRQRYKCIPRHELSSKQLQQHYDVYQVYYESQRHLLDLSSFQFLAEVSKKLPNLRKVSMSSELRYNAEDQRPIWRSVKQHILVGPDHHPSPWGEGFGGVIQTLSILYACEASQRGPVSLDLDICKAEFWASINALDDIAEGCGRVELSFAFYQLKNLKMKIDYDSSKRLQTRNLLRSLASLVRRCTNLQNLDIHVARDMESQPRIEYDFFKHFGSVSIPHLKELKLSLPTTEKSLMRFLKKHSTTLRSLSLESMELLVIKDGGSWRSVIRELPYALTLSSIWMESLEDSEFGNNYLTKKLCEYDHGLDYYAALEYYCLHGGLFPRLEPPPRSD